MTSPDEQRRLLELFDRMLDVPADRREAWILEQTGDEPDLRAGLEALLAGHEVEAGPLDRGPGDVARRATRDETADRERLRDRLSEALGDRYELEEELGRGGMAVVFRARERKHDRAVVLKVLRPELRPFLGEDRFEREVRIASRMSHPNIIGLIDSGTAGDLPFFVMPFVEGETLRARLAREGRLPLETVRTLLHGVAAGLAHAHRLGIVHRDLKPDNILCAGDHPYIMDFGIARPFAGGVAGPAGEVGALDDLTRPGLALGTPRYMSPEQREGRSVDFRTDLYAWGLLARELAGGDMPPAWLGVAEACLAENPADRPESATVLLRALARDPGRWSLRPLAERAWPWAAAAAALGLLAWGAVSRADGPPEPAPAVEAASLPLPLAVAPFRNETDDPGYDMLGRLTSDWIVQGLQQADVGPVVPWPATRAAAEELLATGAAEGLEGTLGEELQAGSVISGAIYAIGDRLSFAATVTDVRGRRVISAPAPISVPPDSAEAAIRELRDRILGSLAIEQDPLLSRVPGMSGKPPVLEAYRAYERGLELFDAQEYGAAQAEYERAFALDTTFLVARLGSLVATWNQRLWAQVDTTLAFLELRRDRLTEYHDLRRRSFAAQRGGDGERAFRLELRRAELGPTPRGSYNAALLANDLNRPDEALRLLVALDPNGPGLRGWAQYWTQLAHAYHGLGRFDEELAAAREMWARFPERRVATVLAARALAAASRRAELDSLFSALRLLPADTYWSLGAALVVAGEETRAHTGDADEADRLLRQGAAWLEERLQEKPGDRSHRYWLASAMYDLEQFEPALRLFSRLWEDFPGRTDYRAGALVSRTHLEGPGVARERLGADEMVHGHEFATLARVEAAAGEQERAMALLNEAIRRGIGSQPWLHASTLPDLGRYAGDPRYVLAVGRIVPPSPYD